MSRHVKIRHGTTLTNKQRESLIRLVHERKFLWEKSDPDHNNRVLIENAWREIADQIGTDMKNARRKWRNLKDIYGRSKKIHERQVALGTSVGEPSWPFFKQMHFVTFSSQDDDEFDAPAEQSADGELDAESMHSATAEVFESSNMNSSIDLSRIKSEKLDEILYNASQCGANLDQLAMTSLGERKSCCSAFGNYVEERLSMLPLSVRLDAEHEICNILKVKLQESEGAGSILQNPCGR